MAVTPTEKTTATQKEVTIKLSVRFSFFEPMAWESKMDTPFVAPMAMEVKPISKPLKIPIIVTMPNFFTLVRNSMKGIPVIKDHRAPRIGRKMGTNPIGMATQQPITK